ncbi:MAG: GNAT family N-acetyltransferase [Alphaproteobacteria bacterium]|nr:GNAT family N-acetyltransferase [Alphaproteobacteria bacterium]
MSELRLAPCRIVPARSRADIAAARTLFEAYAASLDFSLCFQDFDRELKSLPGEYAPPRGALLLARREEGGAAIGCVALRPLTEAGVAEMKRLYLAPEARGLGVGRRLVQEIVDEARRLGYRTMKLDTVAGSMQAAIGLYRDFGFHETAPYTHNPQPDVIYMERTL